MFSAREESLINIVGKKSLSFGEIAQRLFKNDIPMDANIKVNNCVNRIIMKCEHHEKDWALTKSKVNKRIVIKKEKK